MLSQWHGFHGSRRETAEQLQNGLLGEEPVDLLLDAHPDESTGQENVRIEVPAENTTLVLQQFCSMSASEVGAAIRLHLNQVRRGRLQKQDSKKNVS
ncbi:MAG: hypothetical protein RH862_11975 [Leptospiraceae bacterium]